MLAVFLLTVQLVMVEYQDAAVVPFVLMFMMTPSRPAPHSHPPPPPSLP